MPRLALVLGLVLVVLGVWAYATQGETKSVTALIPAFFGAPITLLGILGLNDKWRKHTMHAAVALALLGFLGAARGLPQLPTLFSDPASLERPRAGQVQSGMALLCLIFVVLGVVSFVRARRKA